MRTRLIFVPAPKVRLELLCHKTTPIMLAEMLRTEGISADFVDLSDITALTAPRAVSEAADPSSGNVHHPFLKIVRFPFRSLRSSQSIKPPEAVASAEFPLQKILKPPLPTLIAWYVEKREDYVAVKNVSRCVHSCVPEIHQTIIGPYLDYYGVAALHNFASVDTGITGDVPAALTALSENLDTPESWGRIPGLMFRTRTGITCAPRNIHPVKNLSPREFNMPVRVGLPRRPLELFPLYPLDFSCTPNAEYGLKPGTVRPIQKSVSHLLDEMHFLNRNYGAGVFHIEAAHVAGATLERFADTLLAGNLMSIYSLGGLTEPLDAKAADRLFASGCRAAGFKIPTGSQRLLEDFYGCDMSISAMRATLRRCRAAGIFTVAHLCYPCPWDDYHTRAETELFLEACRPDSITINAPELLPDSIWFSRAPAYGFVFDHRTFQHWVECEDTQPDETPYQMQHWKRGRSAEAKRSLATHAENLGCITGVSEKHGLLARIARSFIDETTFLNRLKQALHNNDTVELTAVMQCISNTLNTLHTDSMLPAESAKAL